MDISLLTETTLPCRNGFCQIDDSGQVETCFSYNCGAEKYLEVCKRE